MAIGIRLGKRTTGDEPVDELLACHSRIRDMTAMAHRLGATVGPPAAEVAAAAARIERYFAEALPHHVDDEESSVLPRLRGRDPELDTALATMHAEHASHARLEARLVAACAALAADPSQHPALAGELTAIAAVLEGAYAVHLAAEERLIFPAVASLPDADRQQIRAEMRARRGVPPI
jgi:hemerythrin-like domain-containing protein